MRGSRRQRPAAAARAARDAETRRGAQKWKLGGNNQQPIMKRSQKSSAY